MSEYHFSTGRGKVSGRLAKRADAVARKHGAYFVAADLPEGPRYWFSGPNLGHPFDAAMARAVREDLAAAGLDIERLGSARGSR